MGIRSGEVGHDESSYLGTKRLVCAHKVGAVDQSGLYFQRKEDQFFLGFCFLLHSFGAHNRAPPTVGRQSAMAHDGSSDRPINQA
jgi:hypothetical protein